MKFISHRGNLNGRNSKTENLPEHIFDLLYTNVDVEIDVWKINDDLFLGHDFPEHKIKKDFLFNELLWCHAKNLQALEFMLRNDIHCFWHQNDDYTLTSKGFIWTFPNKPVCKYKSIIVDLEPDWKDKLYVCEAVCGDYI